MYVYIIDGVKYIYQIHILFSQIIKYTLTIYTNIYVIFYKNTNLI